MYLMSFDVDGAEGTAGAEILTGSAANAAFFIDNGDLQTDVVSTAILKLREAFGVYHLYGSRRTMAGTIATDNTIGKDNTVVTYPNGMADLRGGFFLDGDRMNSSYRTDIGAGGTFGTTVATLVGRLGLHEVLQVGGGTEHVVGTVVNAELAGSTMTIHIACAL